MLDWIGYPHYLHTFSTVILRVFPAWSFYWTQLLYQGIIQLLDNSYFRLKCFEVLIYFFNFASRILKKHQIRMHLFTSIQPIKNLSAFYHAYHRMMLLSNAYSYCILLNVVPVLFAVIVIIQYIDKSLTLFFNLVFASLV